jgi:hypothetical protein
MPSVFTAVLVSRTLEVTPSATKSSVGELLAGCVVG